MRPLLLPAYVVLLTVFQCHAVSFPEDDDPINVVDYHYSRQYPVFKGRPSGNESQHRLDFQLMLKIRDTLYIAGRDQVYTVNLNEVPKGEVVPSKKLTWRSKQQDRENCAMKGKHKDECHNFIKVFVPRNDEMVFVCGTNAFNPMCRYYRLNTLEYDGEEISGLARCPFDARQTNVALFATLLGSDSQYVHHCHHHFSCIEFFALCITFKKKHCFPSRPGCCAKHGLAEAYKTSIDFPDETLAFIKSHPLMDTAVPSVIEEPWFTKTRVRYRLTAVAVDRSAGPYQNYTVIFVGSEAGMVLKILAKTKPFSLNDSVLLEEIDAYNHAKCNGDGEEDKKVVSLQLDKEHHALFVAFSSCVIRVPLSRCERHGSCKKTCIASRDPYCGWLNHGTCGRVKSSMFVGGYEQDVEYGNTAQLGECHGVRWEVQSGESNQMVHMNVLITCVFAAFLLGAFIAGVAVYCYRDMFVRKSRKIHKDAESAQSCTDSSGSFAKLNGLFDSPVKEYQQNIDSPKLYSNLLTNRKELPPTADTKSMMMVDHRGQPPELAALPTPESTPVLQQKTLQAMKSQMDKAQNNLSASRKETPLKSPQFFPSSPPPHSPLSHGHIPSAIVLPNATHDYNMSFSNSNAHKADKKMQNMDHPLTKSSSKRDHRRSVDSRNTLNDFLKHLNDAPNNPKAIMGDIQVAHQTLMLDPMGNMTEIPPKVPNREASLYSPPSTLPRNSPTKRVDVPTTPAVPMTSLERQRGYHKNSSQRHSISALPKNLNSPNGVLLSRQPSMSRGGYMTPTMGTKMDYMQGTPVSVHLQPSLSRQSSYTSNGTLPRTGIKRTPSLKPDVPPKPSFVPQTPSVRPLNKYSY
uniref:Sema domain-containing protein n=1 Tax=Anolis carolinensis TaxID=28377 RepID=H9G9G1_ANOCA